MKNILLGSDFMFNQELGSRLIGIGYSVLTFSDQSDMANKIQELPDLVILDLEKQELGGLEALKILINKSITVLALTQHRSTELAQSAIKIGASKVIFNSQAAKNIEIYVRELIGEPENS